MDGDGGGARAHGKDRLLVKSDKFGTVDSGGEKAGKGLALQRNLCDRRVRGRPQELMLPTEMQGRERYLSHTCPRQRGSARLAKKVNGSRKVGTPCTGRRVTQGHLARNEAERLSTVYGKRDRVYEG